MPVAPDKEFADTLVDILDGIRRGWAEGIQEEVLVGIPEEDNREVEVVVVVEVTAGEAVETAEEIGAGAAEAPFEVAAGATADESLAEEYRGKLLESLPEESLEKQLLFQAGCPLAQAQVETGEEGALVCCFSPLALGCSRSCITPLIRITTSYGSICLSGVILRSQSAPFLHVHFIRLQNGRLLCGLA